MGITRQTDRTPRSNLPPHLRFVQEKLPYDRSKEPIKFPFLLFIGRSLCMSVAKETPTPD